jgi:hypothetical protein
MNQVRDAAGHEKRVYNTRNLTFLQNIQNSACNSNKNSLTHD